MVKFCSSCGSGNIPDARYCAKCGSAMVPSPAGSATVQNVRPELVTEPEGADLGDVAAETPSSTIIHDERRPERNWPIFVGAIASLLLIAGLYYWLFLADDMNGSTETSYRAGADDAPNAEAKQFFAMTEANIRDKPTTVGSVILGKMPRGSAVTGIVKLGADDSSEWLELADGNGFIAMVNLAEAAPPEIVKSLNDKIWTTDAAVEIWSQASTASTMLDQAGEGTKLTLAGLTANDFIEIKLRKGGVGYLAGGAAILARQGGKPISISFDPQTCSFGGEIGAEFSKMGAKLRMQWQELESREFADQDARETAYAAIEGKSTFLKMKRSFDGLSVTAIAQHYESQSVYFADPPAKVIEVFRQNGFRIGNDGTFLSTELYAGISGTRGEAVAYGKTELGCGV